MQIRHARERYVRWLATRDLSPHTIRAYASDIAHFERSLGRAAPVARIDHDHILAFIDEQRAAGISPVSVGRRASCLRGFCKWLVQQQLLTVDPMANTTIQKGRTRTLPRVLPQHDLDRLLLTLKDQAGVSDQHDDAFLIPNTTTSPA